MESNFNLRKFLVENKLTNNSRALSEGMFGDVAFADKEDPPRYAKAQGKEPGSEPNTDNEQEFIEELEDWLTSPMEADEDVIAKYGRMMPQLKQQYPEIFLPSEQNGTLIYRGLADINDNLQNQIEKTTAKDYIPVEGGTFYLLKKPVSYTSRTEIQSYTYSLETSKRFGKNTAILVTKQDDTFFMNPPVYNPSEEELLHIGQESKQVFYLLLSRYIYWLSDLGDNFEYDEETPHDKENAIDLSTALRQVIK